MFDFFKKKPVEKKSLIPEVLGLRLGGVIELDALKMKIIEPDLTISGAANTQLIQAVGVVQLDNATRLIRYYTDDDAMIQVLIVGDSDADVQQCMLSYYYSTTPIDTDTRWNEWLATGVVKSHWDLDGVNFTKLWENELPVAMTETTWTSATEYSQTDQFVMLYSRDVNADLCEVLIVSAEEQIINNRAEHCLVLSTAFELQLNDFKVN
ncbi:YjfK family protein [Photobacterium toruni]|uniref:YjfK family protein n=1 Tax=Photobacterium toruni TaxID=1935446 RepID=UPI00210F3AE4|nr:YjfK family protein [Photobacterium toruni]MEC6814634.1 YjfK family protein [Photobacterium toruni]